VLRQAEESTVRRWRRPIVVIALSASLCLAAVPATVQAAPKPPPNPSDGQIRNAQQGKAVWAQRVGVLSAQVAQAQSQLRTLAANVELKEQQYAYAMQLLDEAKAKAAAAEKAVAEAEKSIQQARTGLTSYVRDSYMSPSVGSDTIDLLTASDPTALLQGGDYQRYISAHHLNAIGQLDRATIAKSNAEAAAQVAKNQQQLRATQADQARTAAQNAYAAEQAQKAQLEQNQTSAQKALDAAKLELATLSNQRAKYLAYQREQAAIAAAKARAAAEARARAAAAAAAAAAAQQQQQQNSGSSVSTSGGWSAPAAPSGPSSGSWTAAKGQAAANKALSQLGVRYAWAGGNYWGATYGVNSPGTDGWNDSQVYGFDCSGLTLFAWYPALQMPHYAASQYTDAGSYHPSPGNFMPGDLLFWSTGGIGGIHHVAMYIGNGNVVQAPNSGDVVKVTPWDQVDYGYFGATRPLT